MKYFVSAVVLLIVTVVICSARPPGGDRNPPGGGRNPPPPKEIKSGMTDLFKESIGNNRFLSASVYKDNLMVHVREYEMGHGKLYPTRKGVSFTKARWASFLSYIDEIDRSVELLKANQPVEYYQHVGGRFYITISKDIKCVNIRRYFLPLNAKKERPTRIGIALRISEWESLVSTIEQLHEQVPELKVAIPCYASEDHANQLGYINCMECNPFGLYRMS